MARGTKELCEVQSQQLLRVRCADAGRRAKCSDLRFRQRNAMRETVVEVSVIHTSLCLLMNHTAIMVVVVRGLAVHHGVFEGRSFLLRYARQHPAKYLPKHG